MKKECVTIYLNARRLFIAVLAAQALFYTSAPLAQTPGAALLDTRLGTIFPICTNGIPLAYKQFDCPKALQEGWDIYKATCAPQATLCGSIPTFCGNLEGANTNFESVSAFNPGGPCNPVVQVIARCPDGGNASFIFGEGAWRCPNGQYAKAINSGTPICPDGQCEANPVNPAVGNKYPPIQSGVGPGQRIELM